MATVSKTTLIAEIGVALSYADGDVDSREIAMLLLALEDLCGSASEAERAVDAAVAKIEAGADVDELLAAASKRVSAGDRPSVFEACAHVLLGDGVLTEAEVQRLAAMKALLAVDDALAFRIVASVAAAAHEANGGLEISSD